MEWGWFGKWDGVHEEGRIARMECSVLISVEAVILVVPVIIDQFCFILSFEDDKVVCNMKGAIWHFSIFIVCHYFT